MKKTILALSVAIVFASCGGATEEVVTANADSIPVCIADSSVVVVATTTLAVDSTAVVK